MMKAFAYLAILLLTLLAACRGGSTGAPLSTSYIVPRPLLSVREVLSLDTSSYTDSIVYVIKGKPHTCSFSGQLIIPHESQDSGALWMRRWASLRMGELLDTLPMTPTHTDAQYQKHWGTDVNIVGEEMMHTICTDFFDRYREEIVYPNVHPTSYILLRHIVPSFISRLLVCYTTTEYSYTGGAHGNSLQEFTLFDLKNMRTLTTKDIFITDSLPRVRMKILARLKKDYAREHGDNLEQFLQIGPHFLRASDIQSSDFPLPQTSVGVNAEGIVVVYQRYEIAAGVAGMLTTILPYHIIWSSLNPEIRILLQDAVTHP